MVRRAFCLITVGGVLLHAMPGCAIGGPDDTQLNPQPLPPGDPPEKSTGSDDPESAGSGSSGGQSPAPNADSSDAGTEGGDGGAPEGDQ